MFHNRTLWGLLLLALLTAGAVQAARSLAVWQTAGRVEEVAGKAAVEATAADTLPKVRRTVPLTLADTAKQGTIDLRNPENITTGGE